MGVVHPGRAAKNPGTSKCINRLKQDKPGRTRMIIIDYNFVLLSYAAGHQSMMSRFFVIP